MQETGLSNRQGIPAAVAASSLALWGLKMSRVAYIMSGTTAGPANSRCDCIRHTHSHTLVQVSTDVLQMF